MFCLSHGFHGRHLVGQLVCTDLFHDTSATILLGMANLWPRWGQLAILLPIFVSYTTARLYILTEAFIGLRTFPMNAYADIQWSDFVHF